MDVDTDAIVQAILYVSRKSGDLVTSDPEVTGQAVRAACAHWEEHERGLVTPELKDAAPWLAFEMKTLQLGRAIDFVMRKLGCWKGRGPLLDAVAEVASDARYRRGRQSFIATLGEHGEGAYGVELAALLHDETMIGYVVKALHRGGHAGHLDEVLSASAGQRPWIRNAAQAYASSQPAAKAKRKAVARPRSRRPPPP
jgi:hypothetical protein